MNKYPEWKIFRFEKRNIFDLCHKHNDEYISIDARLICPECKKSPPEYQLFQAKLLELAVVQKELDMSGKYDLEGNFLVVYKYSDEDRRILQSLRNKKNES